MRSAVRLIDRILMAGQRVYEFTEDPECILRIQLTHSTHNVNFDGNIIIKGDRLLVLHVWNDRTPKIPPNGADLQWALELRRRLVHSMKVLCKLMQLDDKYNQVRAVYGSSALFSTSNHTGGVRMMQHLGFTVLPYHQPLGKFGEFWENLFSWWLMWTYNTASLNSREFLRLQRTEIWISVEDFFARFGEKG